MNIKRQIFGIVIVGVLFIGILFPSCKKDTTTPINPADTAAAFSLVINGVGIAATINQSTLTYFTQENHIGRELDVFVQSGTNQLLLMAVCWDFQNPPFAGFKLKKYFANPAYGSSITTPTPSVISDGSGAIWFSNPKTYLNTTTGFNSEFLEITKCDNYGKKVSGTYNFTLKNNADQNDSIVMSGSFANQTYTVVNK
ncbi:MAG: hypothetical protein WCP69_01160 [Bacteroidota bacterium]|jgi:hypothetical protein